MQGGERAVGGSGVGLNANEDTSTTGAMQAAWQVWDGKDRRRSRVELHTDEDATTARGMVVLVVIEDGGNEHSEEIVDGGELPMVNVSESRLVSPEHGVFKLRGEVDADELTDEFVLPLVAPLIEDGVKKGVVRGKKLGLIPTV